MPSPSEVRLVILTMLPPPTRPSSTASVWIEARARATTMEASSRAVVRFSIGATCGRNTSLRKRLRMARRRVTPNGPTSA